MRRRMITPPGSEAAVEALKLAPGHLSGDHLFLTGMTGSGADGTLPEGITAQTHAAFAKIGAVLAEAGLGFDALVEMTSYHIDIALHFDAFAEVRATYVQTPYPAWTAVEVAGLRRPGALVEIRAIAAVG